MDCGGIFFRKKCIFGGRKRVVSSVGLEHYLDRVGVTGSIPVQPTKKRLSQLFETASLLFFVPHWRLTFNINCVRPNSFDPKSDQFAFFQKI